jgi:arginyl-tRNA synthetase
MGRNLLSGAQRFSTTALRSILSYRPQHISASSTNRFSSRWKICSARAYSQSTSSAANHKHIAFSAMASADSLPAAVESLSLQTTSETSKFPNCYPSLNPVDVYREHIAEQLAPVAGVDAEKIYTRLQWTNTLDKGDLVLPVCDKAFRFSFRRKSS